GATFCILAIGKCPEHPALQIWPALEHRVLGVDPHGTAIAGGFGVLRVRQARVGERPAQHGAAGGTGHAVKWRHACIVAAIARPSSGMLRNSKNCFDTEIGDGDCHARIRATGVTPSIGLGWFPSLAAPPARGNVGAMSPEWLSALAHYNRWMNDTLYGRAATLSDEARKRDGGAFFKSIHGTFNHLLLADRVWLARFTGVTVPDEFIGPGGIRSLDQELYADFEELRRERALTDDQLSAWISGLGTERLAAPLVYMPRGQKQEP